MNQRPFNTLCLIKECILCAAAYDKDINDDTTVSAYLLADSSFHITCDRADSVLNNPHIEMWNFSVKYIKEQLTKYTVDELTDIIVNDTDDDELEALNYKLDIFCREYYIDFLFVYLKW